MFMMRLVLSIIGYIGLIVFAHIFWNNVPQRLYGEPLAGIVVDRATGKPIPGAYVSYLWESATDPKGFFGSGGRDICYHALGTTTDAAGRFHVDGWSEWSTYRVTNQDPQALVYAPGYEATTVILHTGSFEPPIPRLRERYALRRFEGSVDQRIYSLFWGFANRDCSYGGESQKQLYPMWKAIYLEAHNIAQTPEQAQTARTIARLAARTAIAPNPNGPANDDDVEAFVEANLK